MSGLLKDGAVEPKAGLLALLVLNEATHMPSVLDPNFKSLQDMFAKGLMANTDGYEPYAALLAKREQCVNKQKL